MQSSSQIITTNKPTSSSATYDFLLVIPGNSGPMLCRFRDKWRFRSKNTNYFLPRTLDVPAEGVPSELCNIDWTQKSMQCGPTRQ